MIIATCGHELKGFTETLYTKKDFDRKGERVVSYEVLCDECADWAKENNLLLDCEQDKRDWFDGKLQYPKP